MQISDFGNLITSGTLSFKCNKEIKGLYYDSRDVRPNSAFFCFSGTRTHGIKYVDEAIRNGAVLIIANEEVKKEDDIAYLITTDPIRHLYSKASSVFFDHPDRKLKMIGITGTDGKSSTADFIHQLLNMLNHKAGLLTTVSVCDGKTKYKNEYRQSTPEAFYVNKILNDAVKNGCEYFVLEATSHALSDEYDRLNMIEFSTSAYTNISSEHLEFHKTYKSYIDAKCKLAEKTKDNIFVYNTNKEIERIKNTPTNAKLEILTCPAIIRQNRKGMVFLYDNDEYDLKFWQEYNLENAFEAANIVSCLTKTPLCAVLEKLVFLKAVKGRFKLIKTGLGRNVIIDFAHTPDAYGKLLSESRKVFKNGNFIAVFGSSGKRDSSKRPDMGLEISKYCSTMIITEDDPRGEDLEDIFNQLISKIPTSMRKEIMIIRIDDRMEAIKKAIDLSQKGDSLFLLGLGAQKQMDLGDKFKYFDETKTVYDLIKEIKNKKGAK